MSKISFYKYQGTGNDFVIFDCLDSISTKQIVALCDRKYGIGADGVILMHQGTDNHFDMMYYNADGSESFCGNGSRCSVMMAHKLGWIGNECTFNSNDGLHEAFIEGDLVHLKMGDVAAVQNHDLGYVINTGSPHLLQFEDDLNFDIVTSAKEVRYSDEFKAEGINVNFLKPEQKNLTIRTYERGVEDETLSCGTGVTAAVLAEYVKSNNTSAEHHRKVQTQGGELAVRFKKDDAGFKDIYLIGPAVEVFQGKIQLV
jgi:diaminopimelate epimerase